MNFKFKEFKKILQEKYKDKLSVEEIDAILTFDSGIITDKFPQKRISISRVLFKGIKRIKEEESDFLFDKTFSAGVWMVLADNLRGKSSLFKIIKFALTGDHGELAVDVWNWLKILYVEIKINNVSYTVYADKLGTHLTAALYKLSIDNIINTSLDLADIVFKAENAGIFKSNIQDFFFKELGFYQLLWTQKSSQKDKNELNDAHATWNTYFESIYLTSRSSDRLAYGNQEELIFQMLLGLSLTFPINRIKTRLERLKFDLAKLKDIDSSDAKRRASELKLVQKDLNKVHVELEALYKLDGDPVDVSKLYEQRSELSTRLRSIIDEQQLVEEKTFGNKKTIQQLSTVNTDITTQGNHYKQLIQKATKAKINLEEHVNFGMFFSNLDIKVCPHCNTNVSQEKKKEESNSKECYLCNHLVKEDTAIDKSNFQLKIDSLDAEIKGYELQLAALRLKYIANKDLLISTRSENQENEQNLKFLNADNRKSIQEMKMIEEFLRKAKRKNEAAQKEIELLNSKAVLEYRLGNALGNIPNSSSGEIAKEIIKEELLTDALKQLKQIRKIQNEDILNAFKELLLKELQELGISNVTEVRLNDSFKMSYKINDNWVNFENISEGEQIRVKIAFYLSIIQLDSKHQAGKHPRLLIIDSPVKEEGDQHYIEGLKKLLASITEKYKDDLQIIIGTASRQLDGAVAKENAYVYPENEYLF